VGCPAGKSLYCTVYTAFKHHRNHPVEFYNCEAIFVIVEAKNSTSVSIHSIFCSKWHRFSLYIQLLLFIFAIKLHLTIQNRVSLANDEYSSIVDRTLNIRHISTIMNLHINITAAVGLKLCLHVGYSQQSRASIPPKIRTQTPPCLV